MQQDGGGAAGGRGEAPEGKNPDGPGPSGVAPEGKDGLPHANERSGGNDATEYTVVTHARDDKLADMREEDHYYYKDSRGQAWRAPSPQKFDINATLCSNITFSCDGEPIRETPLNFALGLKGEPHDPAAVQQVLDAPGVDVNATDKFGQTALLLQCMRGRSLNVKLLLADPRVNPNLACSEGNTPLNFAACHGADRCVEVLLADGRVDVSLTNAASQTPLVSACTQLVMSMGQVGASEGNDPTRTLVNMLKSRRISPSMLVNGIVFMRRIMPTPRMAAAAEAGGEPLRPGQKAFCLLVPILEAQLKGDFRCVRTATSSPPTWTSTGVEGAARLDTAIRKSAMCCTGRRGTRKSASGSRRKRRPRRRRRGRYKFLYPIGRAGTKLSLEGAVVLEGEEGVAKLGEPEVGVEAARSRKRRGRRGRRTVVVEW